MKVAVFTESFTPYISGVSRSVELLEKELSLLGHEIYVICPSYPNYEDVKDNIIRLPSIPTKYPNYRIGLPIFNKIPKSRFDIVHSHSPFTLGIFAKIFARKQKIPFVYSYHTLFSDYLHHLPLPKFFTKSLLHFYLKRFIKTCDKVIVPNTTTKNYLINNDISGNYEIIPSGVDFDLVQKSRSTNIREKLKIPTESKVLLYVGRLSKEKNVGFLLKSFKIVCAFQKDAIFMLVANGPEEKKLKEEAQKLGIYERTRFVGQVPYPQVLNYYKTADIFVFSSKTETQGLVIAEAKACGLPVVAINANGVSDSIVNDMDGFLTDENEIIFAEKIILLCENQNLRKVFSQYAKENAAKNFSSKFVAKKIEAVYNSLLRKGN